MRPGRPPRCLQVTVGVLALQGDVAEHRRALADLGVASRSGPPARRSRPAWTASSCPEASRPRCRCCSTRRGSLDPLGKELAAGLPVFGTCAGMILLGHIGDRRARRPALLRGHRPHRAAQRLRPPAGVLRVRSGRPRHRRRPVPRRVHPGPAGRVDRCRRWRSWPCSRRRPTSLIDPGRGFTPGRAHRGARDHPGAVPPGVGAGGGLPPRAHRRPPAAPAVRVDDRREEDGRPCPVTRNGRPPSTARQPSTRPGPRCFAKLIRQLEVAAREGGSDLTTNATPAHHVRQGARRRRCPSTPSSAPSSAGSGELEGVRYEQVSYEGYAPGGVADHRRDA